MAEKKMTLARFVQKMEHEGDFGAMVDYCGQTADTDDDEFNKLWEAAAKAKQEVDEHIELNCPEDGEEEDGEDE